jgi:hypothetical protein
MFCRGTEPNVDCAPVDLLEPSLGTGTCVRVLVTQELNFRD